MIYTPRVCKAMKLAFYAHEGQVDKGEYPYFAHPLHLAERCSTESETIVALLHDVLEDAEWAEKYLPDCCTEDELTAIRILTRPEGVSYQDYIKSVLQNELARKIKILDLNHNLDETRCEISNSLRDRYIAALSILEVDVKEKDGASL